MFKLLCSVQNYDWGKAGLKSQVYCLLEDDREKYDPALKYAELWMGSHPNGPSFLANDPKTSLEKYIACFPDCLGTPTRNKFGRSLPFLLKVLSVQKALSIQAHPSKEHAQLLHSERPDLYKDSNHKPELAIALTPFEALIGFRPPVEIAFFVQAIAELYEIVGAEALSDLIAVSTEQEDNAGLAIKVAYQKLMLASEERVSALVQQLHDRIVLSQGGLESAISANVNIDFKVVVDTFARLATDFPGDVGCFSLFFMNHVRLEPGEAVFLEANLPHAYLSGDCVECMACSDNVVRAGLTPKFKDVDCLLSMLIYEPHTAKDLLFSGEQRVIEFLDGFGNVRTDFPVWEARPEVTSFKPPVEDFAVDRITVPLSCEAFDLLALPSASIIVFISGSGTLYQTNEFAVSLSEPLLSSNSNKNIEPAGRVRQTLRFRRGTVVFITAGVSCCLYQNSAANNGGGLSSACIAFRAYANVDPRTRSET